MRVGVPFRPVAPEQVWRASSMRMVGGGVDVEVERRCHAIEAPVIPLPMMTMSAEEGRSGVVRWLARKGSGGSCQ